MTELPLIVRLAMLRGGVRSLPSPEPELSTAMGGFQEYDVAEVRSSNATMLASEIGIGYRGGMIKSELVQIVASKNPHLYLRDVEKVVDAIFERIVEGLCAGDRIELRGFGSFAVKQRSPRAGRNPRNGAPVDVVQKWVPAFKTGKGIRDRLNLKD